MLLTKFAHSTVQLDSNGGRVLIDPGTHNFDVATYKPEDFTGVTTLIVTHKHPDHFYLPAIEAIYRSSAPEIFTVRELADRLMRELNIAARVLRPGEVVNVPGFTITGAAVEHFAHGEHLDSIAVVAEAEGTRVYHTSDTNYLKEKPSADVVLIPISGWVIMSLDEAVQFVKDIRPRLAIPIHYDSPRARESGVDPQEFAHKLRGTGIEVRILGIGESTEI